jgi:hypothetical protein
MPVRAALNTFSIGLPSQMSALDAEGKVEQLHVAFDFQHQRYLASYDLP